MGCDFFYNGNLPNEKLQGKVVNFVKDFFNNIDLVITPDTLRFYPTEINLPSIGLKYDPRTEEHEEYSFNFYGIIPDCKDYGASDHGQFIFNRNDNGRLVKIRRLPDSYGILPHHYYQDEKENTDKKSPLNFGRVPIGVDLTGQTSLPREVKPYKLQVVVDDGGYARLGGGLGFALMLTICKIRWWPDLKMCDDYENCEIVDALLAKYDMQQQMLDESLDFHACHNLFISEYNKDFPSPSSTGSKDDRLKANAQWYLDFMAKIKPFLKDRKKDGADTTTQSECAEILEVQP